MDNAESGANEKLVRDLFARWGVSFQSLCDSLSETMSDDCLFQQTRLPDLVGGRATVAFLHEGRKVMGYETFDVVVNRTVAAGNWVAAERIDYMKDANGRLLATFAAASFMEIRGGKIVAWRDYFDSADMPKPL